MRLRVALASAGLLLWPASARATEFWQNDQNTNGYVSVVSPAAGACFLYSTAAFDIQCYTTVPSSFISGVPDGVLEGVSGAITGYSATPGQVQIGAASGGGLRGYTSLTYDGVHLGLGTPSSGIQTALSGAVSSSLSQLTLAPTGGTAVGNIFNLIPKGAGSFGITSAVFLYNTDGLADPTNYERLLIEGHGSLGYLILSGAAGTGSARQIAIDATGSTTSQLVLGTSGSTSFGAGDILMSKAAAQSITKTGGTGAIGTGDANRMDLKTNGTTRVSLASTGGITVAAFAGGGNQCVQADNTGLLSVTGSACGAGGAGGGSGITQLTGDGTAGPGSGSQAFTLVNLPNDVSQAGDLLATAITAPATPSASKARVYIDSTSKTLSSKDDAGNVTHTARTIASFAGVALTGLSDAGGWTTQTFQPPLTACTDYVSLSCVTGATDLGGTNATPTVTGIETAATMRGYVNATQIATPAAPAAGHGNCYFGFGIWNCETSTSVVSHTALTVASTTGVALTGLSATGTWTTQNFQAPLTACTDYVSLSCVSGATDLGGTNATPTVIGIEAGATQRGSLNVASAFAPSTPGAGTLACWNDNFNGNLECKDSSAGIYAMPKVTTCAGSTWVKSLPATGVLFCSQPAFSDLSGSATCAQMPALTGQATSSAGTCGTKVVGLTDGASAAWPLTGTWASGQALITSGTNVTTTNQCNVFATCSAGGDLSGSYPNPTIPTKGKVLATSSDSTPNYLINKLTSSNSSVTIASASGGTLVNLTVASSPTTFIFAYGAGGYGVSLPSGGLGYAPDFWFRPMSYTVSAGDEFAAHLQVWEYPVQNTYGNVDLSAYVYQCGITTTGGVDGLIFEVTKNSVRTGVKFTLACPAAIQVNTAYLATGAVVISPADRLGVEAYDAATGVYSSGTLRATVTLQLRP